MVLDKKIVRKWLIGKADPAEIETLEMRLIEDEDLVGEISLAENELIEDFLEGGLSDEERESFEKHYLINDERRELLNEVALLKRYSSGSIAAAESGEIPVETSSIPRNRPSITVIAAAAVLLAIFAGWQFLRLNGGEALEKRYTELNRADLNDASRFPSVLIAPGTFRDGAEPPKVRISGSGDDVLVRLPLASSAINDSDFRATLDSGGAKAFTLESAKVYVIGGAPEVRLLLPRSMIENGPSRITLTAAASPPVVYYFVAE